MKTAKMGLSLAAVSLPLVASLALGYPSLESDSAKAGRQLAQAEVVAGRCVQDISGEEQRQLIEASQKRFAQIASLIVEIRNNPLLQALTFARNEAYDAFGDKTSRLRKKHDSCSTQDCRNVYDSKLTMALHLDQEISNVPYPPTLNYYTSFPDSFIKSVGQANAVGVRLQFADLALNQEQALNYLKSITSEYLTQKISQLNTIKAAINAIEE